MGGRAVACCGNVCSTGDQEPIQVCDQVSLTAWPEGDQNGASSGGGHHVGVICGQEVNVGVHTGPLRTFAFCCYADERSHRESSESYTSDEARTTTRSGGVVPNQSRLRTRKR
jgi:hypothetical protein